MPARKEQPKRGTAPVILNAYLQKVARKAEAGEPVPPEAAAKAAEAVAPKKPTPDPREQYMLKKLRKGLLSPEELPVISQRTPPPTVEAPPRGAPQKPSPRFPYIEPRTQEERRTVDATEYAELPEEEAPAPQEATRAPQVPASAPVSEAEALAQLLGAILKNQEEEKERTEYLIKIALAQGQNLQLLTSAVGNLIYNNKAGAAVQVAKIPGANLPDELKEKAAEIEENQRAKQTEKEAQKAAQEAITKAQQPHEDHKKKK